MSAAPTLEALVGELVALIAQRASGYAVIALVIEEKTGDQKLVCNVAKKDIAAGLLDKALADTAGFEMTQRFTVGKKPQ